jgi:hypothetical protein
LLSGGGGGGSYYVEGQAKPSGPPAPPSHAKVLPPKLLPPPDGELPAITVEGQVPDGTSTQPAIPVPSFAYQVPTLSDWVFNYDLNGPLLNMAGPIGGAHIALGLRAGLRDFEAKIGADHLLGIDGALWKGVFQDALAESSTTFSVNLDGTFGSTVQEMVSGQISLDNGGFSWELQQLQDAGVLPNVNFYLNGAPVPNPY